MLNDVLIHDNDADRLTIMRKKMYLLPD